MKFRSKLMRKKLKFGRCNVPGHGQTCEVSHDIRRLGTRADDRRDYWQDLRLATLELMER
ncbi:hypothetical protein D3C75_593270 [compost metagenome]